MAMSTLEEKPVEFVRRTFSPSVGIIASPDADKVCQKNHLSFVDLVTLFGKQNVDGGHIADANGSSSELKGFNIVFKDATQAPPQAVLATRKLSEAVGNCLPARLDEQYIDNGTYQFEYTIGSPWYKQYRDTFLNVMIAGDHEYIKHFTACVFVVSSCNLDPMNQFAQMTIEQHQQQQQAPAKLPKWFSADLLRYYVLIRDGVESPDDRAEAIYQSMKAKYGVHSCYLLRINSVEPNVDTEPSPEALTEFIHQSSQDSSDLPKTQPLLNGTVSDGSVNHDHPLQEHPLSSAHRTRSNSGHARRPRTKSSSETACCLNDKDKEHIHNFVHTFMYQGLIPWAERLIRSLSELYNSKKNRGMFKNFFKSTRPDVKPISVYPQESAEMQFRRLADLCFMFQLYDAAYQVYHALKKDFETDKAWMYCAGVQEMAALSVFMQREMSSSKNSSSSRTYPSQYMEGAINVYNSCKLPSFATRAVMLSTDVLKTHRSWLQAAQQFLKLSNEESDLRSALLLEQAAYCYINMKPRQVRKYGFYMVLAGNRYSKCAQRRHALRCYQAGVQIYTDKDWARAENHTNLTISRLNAQLNDADEALACMSKLLVENNETPSQQSIYLKEYCCAVQRVQESRSLTCSKMVIPVVLKNEVMVTTDQFDVSSNTFVYFHDPIWTMLEEKCIVAAQGSLPAVINYSIPSYNKTMKNTSPVSSFIGETQFIRISVSNPLRVILNLTLLKLDWTFKAEGAEEFSLTSDDENSSDIVQQLPIESLQLDGPKRTWVLFKLIPRQRGLLHLQSISFTLSYLNASDQLSTVRGRHQLVVSGPRLNGTMSERTSIQYGVDKRLYLSIQPTSPRLKAAYHGMPTHMRLGEIATVKVTLTNTGTASMKNLLLATNQPESVLVTMLDKQTELNAEALQYRSTTSIDIPNGELQPNASLSFTLSVQASEMLGLKPLYILFYYEPNNQPPGKTRHRCSRWGFLIQTLPSLLTRATLQTRSMNTLEDMRSYLLSLLIRNAIQPTKNTSQEYSILQLICISRDWKLSSTSHTKEEKPPIHVNQSEVALLSSGLQHEQQTDAYHWSKLDFNSETTGLSREVVNQYMYRQYWCEPTPESESTTQRDVASVFALLWKCVDLKSTGETAETYGVQLISLGHHRQHLPEPVQKEDSNIGVVFPLKSEIRSSKATGSHSGDVQYHIKYRARVSHNFSTERLCVVPVSLTVKSFCDQPVTLTIIANSTEDYSWSGRTNFNLRLESNQCHSFTLRATFFHFGVYDMNTVSVECSDDIPSTNTLSDTALTIIEEGS